MAWETFTSERRGWSSGYGTVGARAITFRQHVLEMGLDAGQRFEYLFDREAHAIGLRESLSGMTLRKYPKQIALYMPSGFRKFAGLGEKSIRITKMRKEDGIWILELEK